VFRPGEALLSDHPLRHRTGLAEGMTTDSDAIAAWFAAPAGYSTTKAYDRL
jgi:hypothetical protein